MRPPLISTDIADLPPLLPACGDLDGGLLPALAVHIDALLLQLRNRGFCEIGTVRAVARRLLDRAELLRDPRRSRIRRLVHDPDPELARPRQRVDLVHLPLLMAAQQGRPLLQDDLHAIARVVTAVDPALERRREELLRRRLVALVVDPLLGREDAVLEHPRADVLHL